MRKSKINRWREYHLALKQSRLQKKERKNPFCVYAQPKILDWHSMPLSIAVMRLDSLFRAKQLAYRLKEKRKDLDYFIRGCQRFKRQRQVLLKI